jgi:hypothetical protein
LTSGKKPNERDETIQDKAETHIDLKKEEPRVEKFKFRLITRSRKADRAE